jgi:hypothetical protein
MNLAKLGEMAFLVLIVIAILAGLASAVAVFDATWIAIILVILGLIVGILNISEKETSSFLIAAIALLVAGASSFSILGGVGEAVAKILGFIAIAVAPAAVIVALKAVYALGRTK